MATIAETVTRICDDLSRPESEIGDAVRREVISAIKHYGSKRLRFNELQLTFTVSATSNYALSTIAANTSLAATDYDPQVAGVFYIDPATGYTIGSPPLPPEMMPLQLVGILGVEEPLKIASSGREWEIPVVTYGEWRRRDQGTSAAAGWPEIAVIHAQSVKIYPVPNISATAYLHAHCEFSSEPAGSNSPWLNEGERLIRAHAMAVVAATKLMDLEVAQAQRGLAEMYLHELQQKSDLQISTGRTRGWL